MPRIHVTKLECVKQSERGRDGDEIYIQRTIDSGRREQIWNGQMRTGDTKPIDENFAFSSDAQVLVWDSDTFGKDDYMGSIDANVNCTGDYVANMYGDGGHYKLHYKIA